VSLRFDELVVEQALMQLGVPYIWAGRGDYAVRDLNDGKGLRNVPMGAAAGCDRGLDCSGLVTWAIWKAGGGDLRGWWGADALWRHLPDLDEDEEDDWFALDFYGTNKKATHVAIELGRNLVVEAAGGDSTTLTLTDAMKRGAFVRMGFEKRQDFLGRRSLSATRKLPHRPQS
jgi:cell wall-associated NlpC family hydrolase